MILALDIALKTGWAKSDGSFGTKGFSHPGDNAVLGRLFKDWLADFILEGVTSLVIERPFFRGQCSAHLAGLAWEAHRVAEIHNIPRFEYAPTTIKKFITGSGRAGKAEVMKAIMAKGYRIMTDHEADAIALRLLHEART